MDQIRFNFHIRHVALVTGILLTVSGMIALYYWGGSLAIFDNYLKIFANGVALTALVYAAMHVSLIYSAQQKSISLKRKEFSSQLITQFNSPEMMKLSIISHALRKEIKDLDPKEVVALLDRDNDKKVAMVTMLNFFEKLAISIEHDLADERVLNDFFRGIVRNNSHALKGFIEQKRSENQNNKIFDNFVKLAEKWN